MDTQSQGQRIQSARLAAGATQQQLADRIGVTRSAVCQWENAQIASLSADNLVSLAIILGVSERWILGKSELARPRREAIRTCYRCDLLMACKWLPNTSPEFVSLEAIRTFQDDLHIVYARACRYFRATVTADA